MVRVANKLFISGSSDFRPVKSHSSFTFVTFRIRHVNVSSNAWSLFLTCTDTDWPRVRISLFRTFQALIVLHVLVLCTCAAAPGTPLRNSILTLLAFIDLFLSACALDFDVFDFGGPVTGQSSLMVGILPILPSQGVKTLWYSNGHSLKILRVLPRESGLRVVILWLSINKELKHRLVTSLVQSWRHWIFKVLESCWTTFWKESRVLDVEVYERVGNRVFVSFDASLGWRPTLADLGILCHLLGLFESNWHDTTFELHLNGVSLGFKVAHHAVNQKCVSTWVDGVLRALLALVVAILLDKSLVTSLAGNFARNV